MFCCQLLCFTVMDAAEIARRDQVVDMHIPQRGAILCLVLAEEPLELAQAFHLGAVETQPARYLGEITPDVGRVHRIDAMRSELMCLGPIAAVVDDADQQLDAVARHRLQLLNVLIEAAVAVDQQHLAVIARRSDANRRWKA